MKTKEKKMFKNSEGFTLVELLVAVSLFIILFVAAIGIYTSALRNQRFLSELILINNNASLVLEQMAREMRTGYFDVGQRATGVCLQSISFMSGQEIITGDRNPVTVQYSLSGENIKRTVRGVETIMNSTSSTAIKKLCFDVIQTSVSGILVEPECLPPRFVIRMEVKSKHLERENPTNSPSSFLQTTVSSRVLPREIQTPSGADPYKCKEV